MSGRLIFVLILAAFAVALAVVIGNRMSAEAMAVVIGVTCGVAASIPMSAVILYLANRREKPPESRSYQQESYPPVVVISPGQQGQRYPSLPYYTPSMADAPRPRQFNIVGDE
ncbi:MAG: hypothetical protein L6435_02790 [Anaerolineae bacterium]|nr:hypothetical protein [Anaerolineae bacterium]